ncbi:DUF4236 domain-containing protein [Sphingobium fluviale]|uniref:DUF4236 domain-containing protein n=1 Tax=Sphingobium fluviale TaxID=2506423 RepID=A0A4V1N3M2_9SPHN|nr:DUF4236 domain-containing protein [Sphingobium fluviale]RXR29156.1 DUF4236 domain-containing protein [Sphingobium fluviale]
MGFRFRKSVKILPGFRINLSKSGVSTSLGRPGATVNISKRGTRYTTGLPGTGLSYSALAPKRSEGEITSSGSSGKPQSAKTGCGCVILLLVAIVTIGQCSSTPDKHDAALPFASGAAMKFGNGDTVYVTASQLNARDEPSASAKIVTSLPSGASVQVIDRSGEWLKIMQDGAILWIAAQHVSSEKPSIRETLSTTAPLALPTRSNDDRSTSGHSGFGKQCKKGKPCGNACISRNRVCHK